MNHHGLKEKKENKNDCCTHECKCCVMLMKFQWKVEGSLKHKPEGGGRSYHVARSARHLENNFDEVGRLSIQQCLIEKINKIIEYEDEVKVKEE